MTSRLLTGTATIATAMLVSCYPYPEEPYFRGPPPQPGQNIGPRGPVPYQQQQQEAIRLQEQARQQQAEAQRPPERRENPPTPPRETRPPTQTTPPTTPTPPAPPPPPKPPERVDFPFASPVVGKEGFVLSPYNNKQIDVRGMQTGTLVRDPTYPEEERKFFRVP